MTLTAFVLLIIAACTHAGWNLLGKRQSATPAFMLMANTLGCLFLAPILLFYGKEVPGFPPLVWICLAITGFFQAWYYVALASAYRSGDLSIAYPLARSFPVIFVTLFTFFFSDRVSISWLFCLGMLLVVGGSFVLPMPRFSTINWRKTLNHTSLMALAAAFGTAGYSIVDDRALTLLRQALGAASGNTALTVSYAFLEGISASIWLGVYVLGKRKERQNFRFALDHELTRAGFFGFIIYLTYTLVLLAMAYVTDVSYVVAFRQLSIPVGALMGILILKEPRHRPKFVGVGIMFLGLVLIGIG